MTGRMSERVFAVLLAVVLPLIVLSVAHADASMLVAGIAVIAVGVLAGRAAAVLVARAATDGSGWAGRRARAHRRGLAVEPAPQHPRTEGRRRARAPSVVVAAT